MLSGLADNNQSWCSLESLSFGHQPGFSDRIKSALEKSVFSEFREQRVKDHEESSYFGSLNVAKIQQKAGRRKIFEGSREHSRKEVIRSKNRSQNSRMWS